MKFDVCVVGSGAGGALAAYALQHKAKRVAIIEKGVHAVSPLDPITTCKKYYRDQGFTGSFGNTFIGIPTGQVVGGTTKINSGTCLETPQTVLLDWKNRLGLDISLEDLNPHFDHLKTLLSISPVSERYMAKGNLLFAKGLEQLGFKNYFPLNRCAKECQGSGLCCFICPKEAKQSTDVAILPKFLKNGGELLSQTEVLKIQERENNIFLWCRDEKKNILKIECSYLVLSAGALSTPHLIRKNKIGTAWRHAGNHLTIHPAAKVFAEFDQPLYGWKGVPQALGFKHPKFADLAFEGVFTPFQLSGIVMPLDGKRLDHWLKNYHRIASFGVMVKDSGFGSVRQWPLMGTTIHYNLTPHDFKMLLEGIRFIGLCYLAAGAKRVLLPLNSIQNEFEDFKMLQSFNFSQSKPSQLYSMAFHPLGTCGMGRIVDSELKVKGSRRISIADGSVVPTALGVNPQITIMALALRLAKHLNSTWEY